MQCRPVSEGPCWHVAGRMQLQASAAGSKHFRNVHSKGIACSSFQVALPRLALAHLQGSSSGLEVRMDARWLYRADEPGAWAALGRLRCHLLVIPSEPGDGAAQVREHVL